MQHADQIPFIMVSAERKEEGAENHNRTIQLQKALEMTGFTHKPCLGHFEDEYENSFAVFLDGKDRDRMSELDEARFVFDLALYFRQDSVLFVGPKDNIYDRAAYLIENANMQTAIAEHTLNVGKKIGHWRSVPYADRHAYGDFTIDLLDSERVYIVE